MLPVEKWELLKDFVYLILTISPVAKMTKMRLLYFVHAMRRKDSLEKTIMLGRIEDKKKRGPNKRWIESVKKSQP